jgi:phthalate 4,5-dioxygenase oxygenase subunit
VLNADDNAYLTQTGPGSSMGAMYRSFWIPVLLSEELPVNDSIPVRVSILGEPLVAFRDTEGVVGLLAEGCPHRTASLYFGRNEEGGLRCTYHGWKFDASGTCLDMPNEPAGSSFKNKVRAVSYPTVERAGVVWAWLGGRTGEQDSATAPQLPDLEWATLPASHVYVTKVYVDCNFMQAMEGDVDSSHSAFLHSRPNQTIDRGSAESFRVEDLRSYSFRDKAPRFFTVATDCGVMLGARRHGTEEEWYWRVTQWLLPGYSIIPREEGSLRQCNMRIPADDGHHWFFRAQYHPDRPLTPEERWEFEHGGNIFQEVIPGTYLPRQNLANDFLIDRTVQKSGTYSGIKGVPSQDQSVTVTMGAVADRGLEHLGVSDAGIIAVRRRMIESARQLDSGESLPATRLGDEYNIRGVSLLLDKEVPFDVGAHDLMFAPTEGRSPETSASAP